MKLGASLTLYLVGVVFCTMVVFGYLSIQHDTQNVFKELRLGMVGFAEAIQQTLSDVFGDERDLEGTRNFVASLGPEGNIHGIVVFDASGETVTISPSLADLSETVSEIALDEVLETGDELEGLIQRPGQLIYYRLEPIRNSSGILVGAFLLLRQGDELIQAIETRRNRIIVTTAILVVLICLLIFTIVQTKISRPIRELIARIREIGAGHWEQRIEVRGGDEISALAQEFNHMSSRLSETHSRLLQEQEDRLQLERDLRHSEKLASVGQLAAGVAHEIGTPLNIIGGRAEQLLRRQRTPEEINEVLQTIRNQIDRIAGIVRQLLEFSRRKEPAFRKMKVSSVIANVNRLFQHQLEERGVTVNVTSPDTEPTILADPDQLQQVFINLFQNSLQAFDHGGIIHIECQLANSGQSQAGHSPGKNYLRISFEDNGLGIREESMGRVFEPFFTTKDIGEGTGLGLAVSYGIIKEHGGDISVESDHKSFTRFVIHLPMPTESKQTNGGNK